jgi:hypothetical protein
MTSKNNPHWNLYLAFDLIMELDLRPGSDPAHHKVSRGVLEEADAAIYDRVRVAERFTTGIAHDDQPKLDQFLMERVV